MKILSMLAGPALLACNLACFAQNEATCGQTLDAPLKSNALLTIDSRPAGIDIVGTDEETIHVTCTADDSDRAQQIKIRLSGTPGNARLAVTSGSMRHGNLQIRIQVPRKTGLRVEMGAGQVTVTDVAGDKDIALYAGQITIRSAGTWNYRSVDASVGIGEVNASVYGAEKGGFFRSFSKTTADGEYRLRAHLLTGQIELLGTNAKTSGD